MCADEPSSTPQGSEGKDVCLREAWLHKDGLGRRTPRLDGFTPPSTVVDRNTFLRLLLKIHFVSPFVLWE
jgi:hypothetical protein